MDPIKGFAQAMLIFAKLVYQMGYPGYKVTPAGFLNYLLLNRAKLGSVNLGGDKGNGHCTTAKIRYNQRMRPERIQDEDSCDIDYIPEWSEEEVPVEMLSKFAIFIPNSQIAKYAAEASSLQRIGDPTSSIFMEFWETLLHVVNGLVGKMDQDLLTAQAAAFGINVVTGSNAAQTVNIDPDRTVNDLTTGLTKILSDAYVNEFFGDIDIVGSGLFNNYQLQQAVKGLDSAGIDTSRFTGYKWHFDQYAQSLFGTNEIGVFERGASQLVEVLEHRGNFGGSHGGVHLGVLPIPTNVVNTRGEFETIWFDFMLKFNDCPSDVQVYDSTNPGYGYTEAEGADGYSTQTIRKGYYLILTKKYGLFNRPADMFHADDRLAGNNGTLRYTITNS